MDIDQFIVRTTKEDNEAIDDHMTIAVPESLRLKVMSLPKNKRCDLYDSVRRFMKHLEHVYSTEQS